MGAVNRLRDTLRAAETTVAVARHESRAWVRQIGAGLPDLAAVDRMLQGATTVAEVRAILRSQVADRLREWARSLGRRAAVEGATLVAICPHPAWDGMIAGGRGLLVIRQVATLYGLRPGLTVTLALVRRVAWTAAGTTGLALVSQGLANHALSNLPVIKHVAGALPETGVVATRLYRLAGITADDLLPGFELRNLLRGFVDWVEPEFLAQMRELLRVHAAPVGQQFTERGEAGDGEVGAQPEGGLRPGRERDQAPLQEADHGLGDLGLVRLGPRAPGAQEDAVDQPWVAAEVPAELAANEVALDRRERAGIGTGHTAVSHGPGACRETGGSRCISARCDQGPVGSPSHHGLAWRQNPQARRAAPEITARIRSSRGRLSPSEAASGWKEGSLAAARTGSGHAALCGAKFVPCAECDDMIRLRQHLPSGLDHMAKKSISTAKPVTKPPLKASVKAPAATKASAVKVAPGKAAATKQPAVKPAAKVPVKAAAPTTVTQRHLSAALAERHEMPKKQADAIVTEVFGALVEHLKAGERVRIGGLGIIEVKNRPARARMP